MRSTPTLDLEVILGIEPLDLRIEAIAIYSYKSVLRLTRLTNKSMFEHSIILEVLRSGTYRENGKHGKELIFEEAVGWRTCSGWHNNCGHCDRTLTNADPLRGNFV